MFPEWKAGQKRRLLLSTESSASPKDTPPIPPAIVAVPSLPVPSTSPPLASPRPLGRRCSVCHAYQLVGHSKLNCTPCTSLASCPTNWLQKHTTENVELHAKRKAEVHLKQTEQKKLKEDFNKKKNELLRKAPPVEYSIWQEDMKKKFVLQSPELYGNHTGDTKQKVALMTAICTAWKEQTENLKKEDKKRSEIKLELKKIAGDKSEADALKAKMEFLNSISPVPDPSVRLLMDEDPEPLSSDHSDITVL